MAIKKYTFGLSAICLLLAMFLLISKGLNFGIDFQGGTIVQLQYDKKADINLIRQSLKIHKEFSNVIVTEFGSEKEVIIKLSNVSKNISNDMGDVVAKILKNTGNFEVRRVDIVGAKVGGELRKAGILAFSLSILVIIIYITIRFEWRFSIASIMALLHDVGITVGFIIIFGIDVNLDILAAILTIVGYSLNDTIIVFDRIRERLKDSKNGQLKDIVNEAISGTISRTTLTSLTTFFVVLTLYLFGGEILNGFSLTLLVGVIVGTYSSIFIASSFLFILNFDVLRYRKSEYEKRKKKKEKDRLREMYEGGVA
jgi:preprotein translocase subunit SecF